MASARKGQVPIGWNQYCLSETIGGSIKIKNFSRHGKIRKMLTISLYVRFRFTSTHSILDLRSVGYFKVSYQKLITMAESRQTLRCIIVSKSEKTLKSIWMNITKCQGQRYSKTSQSIQDNTDKYPWLAKDDPRRYKLMQKYYMRKLISKTLH